jgi:hypothetical protein
MEQRCNDIGRGAEGLGENPVPVSLFSQIPHELTWARSWVSVITNDGSYDKDCAVTIAEREETDMHLNKYNILIMYLVIFVIITCNKHHGH